jgi:hypothetical protein
VSECRDHKAEARCSRSQATASPTISWPLSQFPSSVTSVASVRCFLLMSFSHGGHAVHGAERLAPPPLLLSGFALG